MRRSDTRCGRARAGFGRISSPWMELTDGNITLRPASERDADAAFGAVFRSMPELKAWMPWAHDAYSLEDSRAWTRLCAQRWASGDRQRAFFIWDASGRFLGSIDLRVDDDGREGEIGYWVDSAAAGRGICTAAVGLVARWGFEEFGLDRIRIRAAPDNAASRRVAEKAGGALEPEIHRHVHEDGTLHELVTYVLKRP